MGQSSRAFRLAKASWGIVLSDPWLLVLPAISAVLTIVVAALIFVPAGVIFSSSHSKAVFVVAGVVAAYPLTFVAVFFRFAFVVVISGRLDGRATTVQTGLEIAWGRRAAIARWALIATAVALLIRALRQLPLLNGLAGSITSWILGVAWGALTFFVVPVIAIEGLNGRKAVNRSASLFRERWGLETVGVVSIAVFFVVAGLAGAVVAAVMIAAAHASVVAVSVVAIAAVAGLIGLLLTATATQQAFSLVLYRYATGRPVPAGFSEADLRDSVQPKKRKGLFGR